MIVVTPCDETFYHPSALIPYVKKKILSPGTAFTFC